MTLSSEIFRPRDSISKPLYTSLSKRGGDSHLWSDQQQAPTAKAVNGFLIYQKNKKKTSLGKTNQQIVVGEPSHNCTHERTA